jgi:hypothetical protein
MFEESCNKNSDCDELGGAWYGLIVITFIDVTVVKKCT